MPINMEIPTEEKNRIIQALEKAGAILPCPRCGNQTFSLVGGYFNQFVQPKLAGIIIGGPSVPSVAVICDRCGFIAQHALGTLKLLPSKAEVAPTKAPPEGENK